MIPYKTLHSAAYRSLLAVFDLEESDYFLQSVIIKRIRKSDNRFWGFVLFSFLTIDLLIH